ncbi:MAG: hypothetical protein NTY86_12500 [Deltaproteobacteria bacterium]|nr:hypothetical protein [Deltaproteobacteria bacterium]
MIKEIDTFLKGYDLPIAGKHSLFPFAEKIHGSALHLSTRIQRSGPLTETNDLYLQVWIFGKDRLDACHPGLIAPTIRPTQHDQMVIFRSSSR